MCPPLTEHEKRKSKIQNKPHSNTIGKNFLGVFKSMKQQSEVNIFQVSSCMNIEQIKNMKSEPKRKSKITTKKLLLLRFIIIILNLNIPRGSIYTWRNK